MRGRSAPRAKTRPSSCGQPPCHRPSPPPASAGGRARPCRRGPSLPGPPTSRRAGNMRAARGAPGPGPGPEGRGAPKPAPLRRVRPAGRAAAWGRGVVLRHLQNNNQQIKDANKYYRQELRDNHHFCCTCVQQAAASYSATFSWQCASASARSHSSSADEWPRHRTR
jgi:hypothetical protein